MDERVNRLGGTLQLESASEQDACLRVRMPL
jgi:signal transduction histidine kinase